jgi:mannose-6-phosphate isomerase-like protein (cupin superfamily)
MFPQTQPSGAIRDALQTGKVIRTDLQPAPLRSNWILEGNPVTRSLALGEGSDEFVHILEGSATIRLADTEVTLSPGDVAFFPQGATTYWTVPHYVKKLATFRSVQAGLMTRIVGKMKRVLGGP